MSCVTCQVSSATCNMSCGRGCLSPVTCHQSLTPTATDFPPAKSPTLQSKLVCNDQKIPKKQCQNKWNIRKKNIFFKYTEVLRYSFSQKHTTYDKWLNTKDWLLTRAMPTGDWLGQRTEFSQSDCLATLCRVVCQCQTGNVECWEWRTVEGGMCGNVKNACWVWLVDDGWCWTSAALATACDVLQLPPLVW